MNKKLLAVILFLVCFAAGYVASIYLIRPLIYKDAGATRAAAVDYGGGGGGSLPGFEQNDKDFCSPESHDSVDDKTDTLREDSSETSIKLPIDSLRTPFIDDCRVGLVVGMDEYHYTAKVIAHVQSGDALDYFIESADKSFSVHNRSGYFDDIPAILGATYYVYAINMEASLSSEVMPVGKFPVKKPIDSITPEELTRIYMTGDPSSITPAVNSKFAMKGKYADYKIAYPDMDMSDVSNIPSTNKEIITKVMMGSWTSVHVDSIEYNALGYAVVINVSFR